jgi:F-type H+-transporting ATPase subunit a
MSSGSEGGVRESLTINIPGIPESMLYAWGVWIFIAVISIAIARKPSMVPTKIQTIYEMLLQYITGLADELIGHDAHKYYPLFIAQFTFILISNLIGLVPGLKSPTGNINFTFGLAGLVFVYFVFLGFKYNGLGYLKQFSGPKLPIYLFPISLLLIVTEVISFLTRPLSLGLRLFCNIFSKELFLTILASLTLTFLFSHELKDNIFTIMPVLLRPFILILGLIIGFIQALVFMVLSMSYIAGAVRMEEH